MSNGSVSIVVVTEIGGRIMEYSLDGQNVLWRNVSELGQIYPLSNELHNYGGCKVWLTPEDQWSAAKDPIIDFGRVNVERLQSPKGLPILRVIGGPSLVSGGLIIREISMDDSGAVTFKQTLRNISSKPIEYGLWDITQISCPSLIAFPIRSDSRFDDGVQYIVAESKNSKQFSVRDGMAITNYAGEFGKIGADSNGPWMIGFEGNLAFVKQFGAMVKGGDYPDGGCSVEVYTADARQNYMQMELLGPLTTLQPGGETSLIEHWQLLRLTQSVKDEKGVVKAVKGMQGKGWIP
jgi:hypothetical protein